MRAVTLACRHGLVFALGAIGVAAIGLRLQAQSPAAVVTVQAPSDVSLYCPLSWTIDVVNTASAPLAIVVDAHPTVERLEDARWRPAHGVNGIDLRIKSGTCGPGSDTITLAFHEREGRVDELRDLAVLGTAGRYRLRAGVMWDEPVNGANELRRAWSEWVEFTVTARQGPVEQLLGAARGSDSAVWRAYRDLMLSDPAVLIPSVRPTLSATPIDVDSLLSGGVSCYDRMVASGITGPILARAYLVKATRLAGTQDSSTQVANLLSLARAQLGTGPDVLYMTAVSDCLEARQACASGARATAESILQGWRARSPRLHNVERMMRRVLDR